ncbi:MAG: serine protease [Candidatus Obscuribacterales bacterium]|nr:serine protease [Candidatus Obscuribacterales bacterium]
MIVEMLMVAALFGSGPQTGSSIDCEIASPVAKPGKHFDVLSESKKDRFIPTLSEGRPALDDNLTVYKGQSQAAVNYCHAVNASVLLIKEGPDMAAAASGQVSCWGRNIWESAGPSAATGFFVDKNGLIATNSHFVRDKKKIFARVADGTLYPTETIYADAQNDIAILRVQKKADSEKFFALKLGSSENLQPGDELNIVGHPLARIDLFISPGKVATLDGETSRQIASIRPDVVQNKFLKLTNHIELGNSGSPVLDKNSKVVAICFARYCRSKGAVPILTLATRAELIQNALDEAKKSR